MIHLVTGGARSGKSSFVLAEAEAAVAGPLAFVATATAGDADMAARIARHREERGPRWRTVEAPMAIEPALATEGVAGVVIDCLTLWVCNLMFAEGVDVDARTAAFAEALRGARVPVWLVTNEVGLGIVPADEVSRRYRDLLGRCNQRVAAVADRVTFMVAGLPLRVK